MPPAADPHLPYVSAEMLIAGANVLWALSKPKDGERLEIASIDLVSAVPAIYRAMRAARAPSDTTAAARQRRHRARKAKLAAERT